MAKFERNLYKWASHPFDVDGYWQFWTDARGDRWSLKTICWTGRQPKEWRTFNLPRHLTEEAVKEFVNANHFVHPHSRYFFHPLKKQAVLLTNETKRNQWLREN